MRDEMGGFIPVFINPALSTKSNTQLPARGHDALHYIDLMLSAMDLETSDWSQLIAKATELHEKIRPRRVLSLKSIDRILTPL